MPLSISPVDLEQAFAGLTEGRDYARVDITDPVSRIYLTPRGAFTLLGRLGIDVKDNPLRGLVDDLGGASLTGGTAPTYGAGELSSVTLVRNAKGGVQPEVKVYAADPAEAQQRATEIFDALAIKYPHVTAGGAGDKKGE